LPNKNFSEYSGVINLSDHGAAPNVDTTEARAANNAAFANALAAAQRTDTAYHESAGVYIPPGDYYFDQPIEALHHWGLKLYGHGRATRLMWRGGASTSGSISLINSRECLISNLVISGENTGIGVQLARKAGATLTPTHNTLEQVEIENFNSCVVIGGANSVDANNDFHEFNHCTFRDYQRYGVDIADASQSYGNLFNGCTAWAGATGLATLHTGDGGGSFAWHGGGASANKTADFILGRHYMPMSIKYFCSENSARFITTEATAYLNLEIDSCRWSSTSLHADNKAILVDNVWWALQLSIRNSKIGDGRIPTPATLIHVVATGNTAINGFEFVNNWVFSTAESVFSSMTPTLKSGNMQVTSENDLTAVAL
jgi:hypothetical protein